MHFNYMFLETCTKCGNRVLDNRISSPEFDEIFHIECFSCIGCKLELQGKTCFILESNPYCNDCYLVSIVKLTYLFLFMN